MKDIYITINANSCQTSEADSHESTLTVSPQRRQEVSVNPHSSVSDILSRSGGIIPERYPNVYITNDGPAKEITAQYFWGPFIGVWQLYTAVDVKMGETKLLSYPPNAVNYGMVKITNNTDWRVFVTAEEQ